MTVLSHSKPGSIFRGRSLHFTLARVLAFSGGPLDEPGWPHRNLHTDLAKAREAGLPQIIVSGTQFEGLLLSHLATLAGPAWHAGGELEARIVKSAFVGDEITPVAVLRSVEPEAGGARVTLDVWCETQAGTQLLVGEARVVLAEEAGA